MADVQRGVGDLRRAGVVFAGNSDASAHLEIEEASLGIEAQRGLASEDAASRE